MRMPESDPMKGIWRECDLLFSPLRTDYGILCCRERNREACLIGLGVCAGKWASCRKHCRQLRRACYPSETSPGTPPAAAQFAAAAGVGPVRTQPSQRQAMLGAGGSLFDGLSVDANPHAANEVQQNAAVPPIATATASQLATLTPPQSLTATLPLQPAQSGDGIPRGAGGIGGMFSGLDLVAEGTSADASAPPAAHLNRSSSAASSDTTAWEANGLRRSHISGQRSQLGSTTGVLSTAGSAGDALADVLSPPMSPQGGTPLCRHPESLSMRKSLLFPCKKLAAHAHVRCNIRREVAGSWQPCEQHWSRGPHIYAARSRQHWRRRLTRWCCSPTEASHRLSCRVRTGCG